MAYTKMTLADFKKKLNDGQYATPAAARRGAGKARFSEEDKAKCQKAISNYFGEDEPKAAKKAAKKSGKKKAARASKAREAKASEAEEQPRAERKKRAARSKPRAEEMSVDPGDAEALAQLHLANERIGTIMQAITAMRDAKTANPDLDTRVGTEAAQVALTNILQDVSRTVLGGATEAPEIDPEVMERLKRASAAASQEIPTYDSPTQAPVIGQPEVAEPVDVAAY